jgi:mRNA interferase MazF
VLLPDEAKTRPALVLSPDRRNQRASTVIVVPCSTNLRLGPWHVMLRRGEGGLRSPSVLKCECITTVDRELLDPSPLGGPLEVERLEEVREAILRALDYDLD